MATGDKKVEKLLLICDLSETSGLGHWMRCHRLAEFLQQKHYEIHVLRSPYMQTFDYFMPVDFYHWHSCASELNTADALTLIKILQELHQYKAVLVDGYHFSAEYRLSLRQIFPRIICIDDINDCEQYHCDLLINSAEMANEIDYSETAPGATLWLGKAYRQLSSSYLSSQQQMVQHSNWAERDKLTVIMGGADNHSLTLPLMKALAEINWQWNQPQFQVITTDLYHNHEMIKRWASSYEFIEVIHQSYDLSQVFLSSRLVVSAAGGSTYEVQACASPSLVVMLAANQQLATEMVEESGYGRTWNWLNDPDINRLANEIKDFWGQPKVLKQIHDKLCFDHARSDETGLAERLDQYLRQE